MKTAEIREISVSELQERIETEKAQLVSAKLNHAVTPLENTMTLGQARRDIARMITILKQKTSSK
ncbi:MAG: 50S ribosomal protein L29 [Mucinivorans sp.]